MTFQLTAPGTNDALTERCGHLVGGGVSFGLTPTPAATHGATTSQQPERPIWDLVRPERRPELDQFAQDYAAIRRAEQRELTADEVRSLPIVRSDHPLAPMWDERARSFARFKAALTDRAAGLVVDIGAGSGWLAADLARSGWIASALDVTVHGGDGLAAARHHQQDLLLVRAEMEALPFASASVDLAVFNASLHYASSVAGALGEACRVLRPGGTLVVLDSPIFTDPGAGRAMVQDFADYSQQTFGLTPARHLGRGFVTEDDVAGLGFHRIEAATGLRNRLHQWRGARRAGRETATLPLLITEIGAIQ